MAIDFNNTPPNKNLTSNKASDKATAQSRAAEGIKTPTHQESAKAASVSVSISSEAKTLERAENRVAKFSSFDKQKVASIKSAIEDGRYSIDPEKLAEKLFKHELGFGSR